MVDPVAKAALAGALVVLAALATACGSHKSDPPTLVLWRQVGDIRLGEPVAQVKREYGSLDRIHGGKVTVYSYSGGRVTDIRLSTPYYRTKDGFGVGSRVPSARLRREGFVYDAWSHDQPCSCWTKVGFGRMSLPATGKNFLKPWFIIWVKHGRVTAFDFNLKYID